MITELFKFKYTCDRCGSETIQEHEKKVNYRPNNWYFLNYSQKGGGHYGLPHHHTKKLICTHCWRKGKEFLEKELLPPDAFDIKWS